MCRSLLKPIATLLQHCWRVSVLSTALKQLPGKNNEEKMDRFIKSGMLNKELRDRFLEEAKKARNYFRQNISAIATIQDALDLTADACDLSLKLSS